MAAKPKVAHAMASAVDVKTMILIGTIHNDPQGPNRLERLLERFAPSSITVEYSSNVSLNDAVEQVTRIRARLANALSEPYALKILAGTHGAFAHTYVRLYRELAAQLSYELDVAARYAKKHDTPIHLVDEPSSCVASEQHRPSDVSCMDRTLFGISLSSTGAQYLRYLPSRRRIAALRGLYIRCIDSDYPSPVLERVPDPAREAYLAERIADIRPDVHIGGSGHLKSRSKRSLWRLLESKGVKFERVMLSDADSVDRPGGMITATQTHPEVPVEIL
ncbi:hypothetical protein HY642_02745 [Candidatus Woesearchaeota archaeon]|nr:hypothetical protein [Candidatus Woesearchaeota archaeon]